MNGECCGSCELEIGDGAVYFVNRRRVCRQCYLVDVRRNARLTWHDEHEEPKESGWYLVDAVDGRFGGECKYRAWGNGSWWIPLADGWVSSPMGLYRWQGPVADVNGPAPDGSNPR